MEELENELFNTAAANGWEKVGVRTHHGINLPLSALHSEKSSGIGEFLDLLPIIDWCHRIKIDFIQLLPLNDSKWDPSPYNAASSCALHPIYLSLHHLPYLENLPQLKKKLKEFTPFNQSQRISYTEVLTHKLTWLHAYFDEVGEKLLKSKELKEFIEEHPWVEPYALFKALQDRLGGTTWAEWPKELHAPTKKEVKTLLERYAPETSFYIVLQFLSMTQLKEVKEYANGKGVFLMGDFPFLMNNESIDVWQFPEFFDTTLSGGAPPDFYNKEGQNWGLALYHWDNLRKKNFAWWKQRLNTAAYFFDLIRLDHAVGFFRIWGIPHNRPSKEGHFIPEDQNQWETQGRELLTMLAESTEMLPIAEDLGTIPPMVRPCLKALGICATKVMRWERKWETNKDFTPISHYPPISITCLSTHDSPTTTLWWKNYPEEAKAYAAFKQWEYKPALTEEQLIEILWDSHHTSSLFHVNLLQEYFALFPELIWLNPEDERINLPGKILPTNWTYRFRPSVETIVSHEGLFAKMRHVLFSPSPKGSP